MQVHGRRVLVTGGAGLIGSHLVDRLIAEYDCTVRILDNLEPQTHPDGRPDWIHPDAELVVGDVADRDIVERALDGVELVWHQAAFGGFTSELSKYVNANSTGTALIYEVIRNRGYDVKKVVAASSQAIYGEGQYRCPDHGPFEQHAMRPIERLEEGRWEAPCPVCGADSGPMRVPETKRADCESVYGISKYAEERLVLGLGRSQGIPSVALRYAVTYGPRQSIYNPYTGVVSIFSTQLLNGKRPVVYEDGLQTRDFMYVGDCARANIFVMESDETAYRAFNVGTGQATTVLDLARKLAGIYGVDMEPLCRGDFRPWDVRHFVHDPSALENLGFKTEVSIDEGLAQYAAWIREQGDVREYFTEAERKLRETGVIRSSRAAPARN